MGRKWTVQGQRYLHAHCQSPTSQPSNRSLGKELANASPSSPQGFRDCPPAKNKLNLCSVDRFVLIKNRAYMDDKQIDMNKHQQLTNGIANKGFRGMQRSSLASNSVYLDRLSLRYPLLAIPSTVRDALSAPILNWSYNVV